jgi:hypothetical protein
MKPNAAIPEEVWKKLLSLPSQTAPKRQARPVKRLTALAHELAADDLLRDAGKKAHGEMHKILEGARERYSEEIKKAREAVLTVEGQTVKADVKTKAMSFDDFVEAADYAVIEDAYTRASRIISPDLARTYSEYLADKAEKDKDAEEALLEAHTIVAALGLVAQIKDYLEQEAEKLSNRWLGEYRVEIKNLSDERQEVYRELREMSADPLDVNLARPAMWLQPTSIRELNGNETELPRFERHLLCDEDSLFPDHFNTWEKKVLMAELNRAESVAWYRNPARTTQDSLGVAYEDANETKILRPDFVFFGRSPDGGILADIVDPHGHHLADALPKLKGLARYAETSGAIYRRIEAIAEINGNYKLLDMKEERVRKAIFAASSAKGLFESSEAFDYVV